jgi:PAS domain S-box-containing protein
MNSPKPQIQLIEQPAKAESTLNVFLRLSLDLLCILGQDGYFQPLNREWEKVLGWSQKELRSRPWIEFVHPDDVELSLCAQRQCAQEDVVEYENRCCHKDGSYRWLSWRVSQEKDGHFYGVAKDITECKLAEDAWQQTLSELEKKVDERTQQLKLINEQLSAEIAEHQKTELALRQSEERYRAIVEEQTELICRFKPDDTITFVNDAYCRYFDMPRESLIGQKFLPAMPSEDRKLITQNFRALSLEQPINTYEHRIILASGEIRWQQWSDRAIFDEEGNFIECQAVGRDITQLKQAEAEIRKALEKEKELSELRASFVSIVSHEFRTPLTTIQSSAELLDRYSDRLSQEKKQNHFIRIQSAVRRMTQLLDDVLTIGKAEAGKLQFNPKPMDLIDFCREIVESMQSFGTYQHTNASHQHTLTFMTHGDCTDAQMDENLLEHILTNLLSNAIKYSPDGGTVQFDLICNQSSAVFRIQDTGIGIPIQDLENLFDSFGRASNVGTIQGTGLGLAIVKRCVDLHGGNIAVETTLGAGTTFTVTLPLHQHIE